MVRVDRGRRDLSYAEQVRSIEAPICRMKPLIEFFVGNPCAPGSLGATAARHQHGALLTISGSSGKP